MADNEREFQIKITGDASSLSAAAGQASRSLGEVKAGITDGLDPALANYGKAAEKASEGAEHMHISHRELSRVLRMVSPEATELGHVLMMGVHNPLLAAAAAGLVLNEALVKIREKLVPDTSELEVKSLAAGFEVAKDAIFEAQAALLEYHDALNKAASSQEELNQQTAASNAMMEAQAKATASGQEAEDKLAMAKLKLAKATGQISSAEYEQRKAATENESERRKMERGIREREDKIAAEYKEADAAANKSKEQQARIPALSNAYNAATEHLKEVESKASTAEENEMAYKKTIKERGYLTNDEFAARQKNAEVSTLAQQELPEAQAAAKSANEALAEAQRDAVELRRKAEQLRLKAFGEYQASEVQSKAQREAFGRNQQARTIEAQAAALGSDEGKLVRDVSNAEFAQQHGQKLTVAQRAQIATLEQMLNGSGENAQAILQLLGRLHGNQEALNKKMQDILRKIENSHNDGT